MTILMYHSIPLTSTNPYAVLVDRFREQMQWLATQGYTVTSLEKALSHRLPADWIVLTFDDAYQTVADNAVPIMLALGFSATVFVPAGLVGGTNVWDDGTYPEETLASWDDLRALREAGLGIGSHTITHARLTRLGPRARFREIAHSRRMIAHELGIALSTFSYPWGGWSPSTEALVRLAGYRAAVVGDAQRGVSCRHRFRLNRVQIDASTDMPSFVSIFSTDEAAKLP